MEELLAPKAAAKLLGLSRSQISRLVRSGALEHFEIGHSTRKRRGQTIEARHVRFSIEQLRAFLDARRKGGTKQ